MAEIRLKAREAAYLRAFAMIALELRFFRDAIDDEADRVIAHALARIGRQLARMRYEDGPVAEDIFPMIFLPRAFLDLAPDLADCLRETFQEVH